jgi:hypothetical protein
MGTMTEQSVEAAKPDEQEFFIGMRSTTQLTVVRDMTPSIERNGAQSA